ncbi:MAG: hypothetical protein PHP44_15775 [Kiritimatiellae bacterium]|nr:hypothetical protein [Kiritimatiellia bacterium]
MSGKPHVTRMVLTYAKPKSKRPNLCKSVQSVDKKTAESESQQLATQLTDQYRKAISGTHEILLFGAMMLQLGGMLNQRGPNRDAVATGPGAKGLGLKGWIEEHCPEINYFTARSFYNLARGLVETLAIPAKMDLPLLLSSPVDQLSKHDANIRAKVDEFLSGKSKRQLEFDFGIRAPKPHHPGGNVQLVKWLRENHPELKGIEQVKELPKSIQAEYEAYLESITPTPEQAWNMRVDNARKYWQTFRENIRLYTTPDNPYHFAPLPKPEKEALLGSLEKVCEELRSSLKA